MLNEMNRIELCSSFKNPQLIIIKIILLMLSFSSLKLNSYNKYNECVHIIIQRQNKGFVSCGSCVQCSYQAAKGILISGCQGRVVWRGRPTECLKTPASGSPGHLHCLSAYTSWGCKDRSRFSSAAEQKPCKLWVMSKSSYQTVRVEWSGEVAPRVSQDSERLSRSPTLLELLHIMGLQGS